MASITVGLFDVVNRRLFDIVVLEYFGFVSYPGCSFEFCALAGDDI